MTRTKWKEKYDGVIVENKDLKKQLETSNLRILELESLSEKDSEKLVKLESDLSSSKSDYEARLASEKEERKNEKEQLEITLSDAKKEIKNKQEQINSMELKKMASAYAIQEKEYGDNVKEWSKYLLLSALALTLSTFWSVIFASGKAWYDRFEFYLIDFIIISAVWFTASQYSYFSKLRNDFANRKTLAQTYQNILLSIIDISSDSEKEINEETKRLFMSKATDVFCAPSIPEIKEPILSKELLKNVGKAAEIIIKSK
ncbi:MAG: hypothetical protein HYV45_03720 [Candidatus Moranbacteria bacterium]|nr:hypothetical protein [Candidatus Moranbacteria bacterium]